MRLRYLSKLLVLLILGACSETKPPVTTGNDLSGNWAGPYESEQAGSCSQGAEVPTRTTVTWQVDNSAVVGTVIRTTGPTVITTRLTGTIDGSRVRVGQINQVICNGSPGNYQSRYEGTISGNTLTLVSRDTLCPAQRCIFLRTLRLTRQ